MRYRYSIILVPVPLINVPLLSIRNEIVRGFPAFLKFFPNGSWINFYTFCKMVNVSIVRSNGVIQPDLIKSERLTELKIRKKLRKLNNDSVDSLFYEQRKTDGLRREVKKFLRNNLETFLRYSKLTREYMEMDPKLWGSNYQQHSLDQKSERNNFPGPQLQISTPNQGTSQLDSLAQEIEDELIEFQSGNQADRSLMSNGDDSNPPPKSKPSILNDQEIEDAFMEFQRQDQADRSLMSSGDDLHQPPESKVKMEVERDIQPPIFSSSFGWVSSSLGDNNLLNEYPLSSSSPSFSSLSSTTSTSRSNLKQEPLDHKSNEFPEADHVVSPFPLKREEISVIGVTQRICYNIAPEIFHPILKEEWKKYIKNIRTTKSNNISKATQNCDRLTISIFRGTQTGQFSPAERTRRNNRFEFLPDFIEGSFVDDHKKTKNYLALTNSFTAYSHEVYQGRNNLNELLPMTFVRQFIHIDTPTEDKLQGDIEGFKPLVVNINQLHNQLQTLAAKNGGWALISLGFSRIELLPLEKNKEQAKKNLLKKIGHMICAYAVTPEFNQQHGNVLAPSQLTTFLEPQALTSDREDKIYVSHELDEIITIVKEGVKVDNDVFAPYITVIVLNSANQMEEKIALKEESRQSDYANILAALETTFINVTNSNRTTSNHSVDRFMKGYDFKCNNLPQRDLYHVIADQINRRLKINLPAEELRAMLAHHISTEQKLYLDEMKGSKEALIQTLKQPTVKNTQILIMGLSRLLNVDIKVFYKDELFPDYYRRLGKPLSVFNVAFAEGSFFSLENMSSAHGVRLFQNIEISKPSDLNNEIIDKDYQSKMTLAALSNLNKTPSLRF